MKVLRVCQIMAICGAQLCAQEQVDPRNRHERVIAIVPLTGAGTYADPRRPLFTPAPSASRGEATKQANELLQYHWLPSDDGRHAVVEFVAKNRAALAPIVTDPRTLKVFEKGKGRTEDLEREIKAFRKDFTLQLEKKP